MFGQRKESLEKEIWKTTRSFWNTLSRIHLLISKMEKIFKMVSLFRNRLRTTWTTFLEYMHLLISFQIYHLHKYYRLKIPKATQKWILPFFFDEQRFQNHPLTIAQKRSTHVCLYLLRIHTLKSPKSPRILIAACSEQWQRKWQRRKKCLFRFLKPLRVNFVNSHFWWDGEYSKKIFLIILTLINNKLFYLCIFPFHSTFIIYTNIMDYKFRKQHINESYLSSLTNNVSKTIH